MSQIEIPISERVKKCHDNFLQLVEDVRKRGGLPKYTKNSLTNQLAQKYNVKFVDPFWVQMKLAVPADVQEYIDSIKPTPSQ